MLRPENMVPLFKNNKIVKELDTYFISYNDSFKQRIYILKSSTQFCKGEIIMPIL